MARKKGRRDNKTGSIYKDGSGYRAQIIVGYSPTTGGPLYRRVRTRTHAEAVDALKRLEAELQGGTLGRSSGATLAAFASAWLQRHVNAMRAPSTYRQYEWVVRTHILPTLGTKRLDKISRTDIQTLINAKAQQAVQPKSCASKSTKMLSRASLRAIKAVLHTIYEDAIKDGIAFKNPAGYVELPPEPRKPKEFLDPNQAKALYMATKQSQLPELLEFLLKTGTRIGEAVGIRWQDIDRDRCTVRICGQLQRIGGKMVRQESTKTNQIRILPLSTEQVQGLLEMRQKFQGYGWEDPDDLVFLNPYGRRCDPRYVTDELKRVCRSAGVPEVSPHKLRHTAATLALYATGDMHAVQKMLGHSQQSLTTDLYGHATAETLRPVADAIGKLLS